MLSHFYHSIQVNSNTYAVFNSLLMDVIYVNKVELSSIESGCINDTGKANLLYKTGIWVTNLQTDENALEALKRYIERNVGIIDIMYLITTQECNLRCSYCFLENNKNKKKSNSFLSKENARLAIRKFADLILSEGRTKGSIIYYGGEPLINKDVFYDSVLYSSSFPIDWNITIITNGTLLNYEIISFCKKHKITVGLSIDGPQAIHDQNRKYRTGEKSSYEECMKAKRLLENANCNYGLSLTLSQEVIKHKEEVFNWLINNHEGEVFFNLLHFSSREEYDPSYIDSAVGFLIDFFELCENKKIKIKEGRLSRQIESFTKHKFRCSDCAAVGCHQITVLPSGSLCICHGDSVNEKYHMGTLKDTELSTISELDKCKLWNEISTLNDEECLKCPAVYICGRGCPHHAESVYGNRMEKDRNYCKYVNSVLCWLLSRGFQSC